MEQKNIIAALIKAQKEIEAPKKDKTGQFKNKYASLDAIYTACRDALLKYDLVLSHSVEKDETGSYYLLTTLCHSSGETIVNKFPLSVDKAGPQGVAAARTYACRYATCNLLALPIEDDDDGRQAQDLVEKKTKSDFKDNVKNTSKIVEADFLQLEEVKQIEKLIGQDYELADRILAGYSQKYKEPIASFYDLRKSDFPALLTRISAMKNPKPIHRQA